MKSRLDTITDEQLINALPHGSGIDCDWRIERQRNGKVHAYNSFHMMDENGMYDGWQDFYILLYAYKTDIRHKLSGPCAGKVQVTHKAGDIDFDVYSVGGWSRRNSAYDLRSYLAETIGYSLEQAGIVDGLRSDVITID